PQLPNILDVFPNAEGIFEYVDGVYVPATEIELNNGYFVNNRITQSEIYCGHPSWEKCFYIEQGWNLIGSYPEKVNKSHLNFNPDKSSFLTFYSFDSTTGRYIEENSLEPGKGYWVLSTYNNTIKMCPNREKLNITCVYECGEIVSEGVHTLCNDIYAENIQNCFNINTENILFDCTKYKIIGKNSTNAFYLDKVNDSIFRNCYVSGFNVGFVLDDGFNNIFEDNILLNNGAGFITSYPSRNISIQRNIIKRNISSNESKGMIILSRNSTIKNNTIEGYNNGLWVLSLPLPPGGISDPIKFIDNKIINNKIGIYIMDGIENEFKNNIICDNEISDVFSIFSPHRANFEDNICDYSSPLFSGIPGLTSICDVPCP
ncbi:MAG: NosD domain-containing protein, partial [Candidatus Micrarchaeia archaeon]